MAGGYLDVKHQWIGDPTGVGDPANVNDATPEYPGAVGKVGHIKVATGLAPKSIQYVKRIAAADTAAFTPGKLAYWQDVPNFVVCSDLANAIGGTINPFVAGVVLGTVSTGQYGFIQVDGVATLTLAGVSVAATTVGCELVSDTTNGVVPRSAATNATDAQKPRVGYAIGSQTATTGTISVCLALPRFGW